MFLKLIDWIIKTIMKTTLAFLLALSFSAFAAEKYGVYDSKGSRLSAFEAERYELPEKTRQIKSGYPNKIVYVSSMQKGRGSKPTSRYRFKAEAGAYIEAARKETFTICPSKEIEGTWISEHSVSLNAENCLSVQTPNLAGTFRILFLENSGRTDTIQVLVEQSYIQMGDYTHRIWVPDSMPSRCLGNRPVVCDFPAPHWHYENREYSQPLIVDKTKLTMGDAQYYSKIGDIKFTRFHLKEYPKNEKLEESRLPLIGDIYYEWRLANERSKKEGLDTAYHIIYRTNYGGKNTKKLIALEDTNNTSYLAIDTSASGYRMPYNDEWLFLMRAGASTRYYWGDEDEYMNRKEDSVKISRYAWINPVGLKQVAQLLPNKFGLYDMVGLTTYEAAEARTLYVYDEANNVFNEKRGFYGGRIACSVYDRRVSSPECDFITKRVGPVKQSMRRPLITRTCTQRLGEPEKCEDFDKPVLHSSVTSYKSLRLLRKTPKLQKLEKF